MSSGIHNVGVPADERVVLVCSVAGRTWCDWRGRSWVHPPLYPNKPERGWRLCGGGRPRFTHIAHTVRYPGNFESFYCAIFKLNITIFFILFSIQVLVILKKLDEVDLDRVADYVRSLQNEDGSFSGDRDGGWHIKHFWFLIIYW